MYEPYSASGQVPEPQRIPPPRTVQNAVKFMYAGAAVEVVALVVALITRSSMKSALLRIHPGYTAAQLHTAVTARARILSAVFFGISTLDLLLTFVAVRAPGSLIIGFVIWLVGLGAIVLLFSRESNAFFRQPRALR